MTDAWDPAQYEKFRHEREQPFFDLLAMVRPAPSMRVVDLGCGTGRQTRVLHERLQAAQTIGIDRSGRMLEAAPSGVPGLTFRQGIIEEFDGQADLIFSNAALHWVEHHDRLVPRLARAVAPGGQLAFQVPAMHGELSHLVAQELTQADPFRKAFGGWTRPQPVLEPEEYARLLYRSGVAEQQVTLRVYPHVLPSAAAVVEWMKGTLLTEYERHLPQELREPFVDAFRREFLARVEPATPFFFPFRRILCWARARS